MSHPVNLRLDIKGKMPIEMAIKKFSKGVQRTGILKAWRISNEARTPGEHKRHKQAMASRAARRRAKRAEFRDIERGR